MSLYPSHLYHLGGNLEGTIPFLEKDTIEAEKDTFPVFFQNIGDRSFGVLSPKKTINNKTCATSSLEVVKDQGNDGLRG